MENFKPHNRLTAQAYINGVLRGDRVVLSRAITLVESNLESDKRLAKEVVQAILPHTGNSFRIGITGVPGVGKSTFIESFGRFLLDKGHKIAILSIDPSSQRSKGSILGDKTRMEKLSHCEDAYIRPSASGDTLGGVANKTAEAMLLCEAAGYDIIMIETVGVGQSETAVHRMSDFFLLLMLAGAGDELQGIKKGIMEMADMIIINKADGDNIAKSEQARVQYQNALHLFPPNRSGWIPKVTKASATEGTGIETIWNAMQEYQKLTTENGYFGTNRNHQKIQWLYHTIEEELKQLFYGSETISKELEHLKDAITSSKMTPVDAAHHIIETFKNSLK